MDEQKQQKLNKDISKTVKEASEEIRGRELNPIQVSVRVVISTKEGKSVVRHSETDFTKK